MEGYFTVIYVLYKILLIETIKTQGYIHNGAG